MGLENRRGAGSTSFLTTLATLAGSLMLYHGCSILQEKGVISSWYSRREEKPKPLAYESPEVAQMAQSALYRRRINPADREKELCKMDMDKDGMITESEVIFYIRNR